MCTGTMLSFGPLHTSGSVSPLRSYSRWRLAICTSHTSLSSTPTTSTSCGGRRRLTPTGTLRRTHTWAVNSATSNPQRDRGFRRRWGLLPRRGDPRSTASDRAPNHYGPLVEPICRLVSGRRIVDLVSRSKKVGRLCAGYRVTCLRLDRARQTYLMGWRPQPNRNYRSPAYGRV